MIMNVYFEKCTDALGYAIETKTYGIFHSTKNNPNFDIHSHECCEILFCLKGGKNFLIDDKIYKACDGNVFILNQFEAHKITFEEDCPVERFVLQLHPEFIFSASTDDTDLSRCFYIRNENTSNCIALNKEEKDYLEDLFLSLKKEYDYGEDVMKNAIMLQLLAFVNQKFVTNHSAEYKIPEEQLKKAVLFINEHLCDKLTLEMIAKELYISVNQLCKLFKSALGTTVMKYVVGKRISQAKKYLKSGISVSETAEKCGFYDYANFIRTFTKCVGTSPGKYKNTIDKAAKMR